MFWLASQEKNNLIPSSPCMHAKKMCRPNWLFLSVVHFFKIRVWRINVLLLKCIPWVILRFSILQILSFTKPEISQAGANLGKTMVCKSVSSIWKNITPAGQHWELFKIYFYLSLISSPLVNRLAFWHRPINDFNLLRPLCLYTMLLIFVLKKANNSGHPVIDLFATLHGESKAILKQTLSVSVIKLLSTSKLIF